MTKYKELRERTGMSAYAFGKELMARRGTHIQMWYAYERGHRTPQNRDLEDAILALLAEKLGRTFNDVLLEVRGKEGELDAILS